MPDKIGKDRPSPVPVLRPSIGRIVHYKFGDGEVLPMIITHVLGNAVHGVVYNAQGMRFDTIDAVTSPVQNVSMGDGVDQWSWPPRV